MTEREKRPQKGNLPTSQKIGLIQFRADENLMRDLSAAADRLNLPVGVLARLWVTERLAREQSFDADALELWRQSRYNIIDEIAETELGNEPIQILHLVPFQRWLDIEPEKMSKFVGLLAPVERVDNYDARINLEGFRTAKQFANQDKTYGYVQVFGGGQLESVRRLTTDEQKTLYVDFVDDDLVSAVWSYAAALENLGVKPPVAVFVRFQNLRGYAMRSAKRTTESASITYGAFNLKGVTINNWGQVDSIESTAQTVKPILDKLANSGGLPKSLSYSNTGHWLGSGQMKERRNVVTSSIPQQAITLSGTNRDSHRVDLVLRSKNGEKSMIIGKVRPSYLEPTKNSKVTCLVNPDEMEEGALRWLNQLRDSQEAVSITAGNMEYKGAIRSLHEGLAGGAFDGINIPHPKVLMIDLVSLSRAQTPGRCSNCGRVVGENQTTYTPTRGTLCRRCLGKNLDNGGSDETS